MKLLPIVFGLLGGLFVAGIAAFGYFMGYALEHFSGIVCFALVASALGLLGAGISVLASYDV